MLAYSLAARQAAVACVAAPAGRVHKPAAGWARPANSRLQRRRVQVQPPRAAAPARKKKGGGGGGGARQQREKIVFLDPLEGDTHTAININQNDLNNILSTLGALGFKKGEGFSRRIDDLPEGGTVELVLPREPAMKAQVTNLLATDANLARANEQEACAFLQSMARSEFPGCTITVLPAAPFKKADGKDYVELDAGVRACDVLLLAEHKRVVGADGIFDLVGKVSRIRPGVRGASPDLAAALAGVTHVRPFLVGEVVQKGMTVQQLVAAAAEQGITVVLPSGQALGVAGDLTPLMPL